MGARKHLPFTEGEYYHIYNRGVDKRTITEDWKDSERFLQSIVEFNTVKPIGSIYENKFSPRVSSVKKDKLGGSTTKYDSKLVEIVAYCLNPNHYHLILTPLVEKGIEKFMQKLGTGFTQYFNEKYNRSGSLFQGKFKSAHLDYNEYLMHVAAYVNLNDKVHQLGGRTAKLVRSSWWEYLGESVTSNGGKKRAKICDKDIVLGQFKTSKEYEKSAMESLKFTLENRYDDPGLGLDLLAKEEHPEKFEKKNMLK
ncbi:MAG: transposase [Candidatus Pacebacteria bacterium]|nr:transposase [Candidatus Paceibacterota bacterium]